MQVKSISLVELIALAQAFVDRKYTMTADARQKSMGLAYMGAERQDLAQEIARFVASLPEQPERFDALRVEHPDLGFALYAMEPGGIVTFEVYTPDGLTYSFKDITAEAAMDQAFPAAVSEVPSPSPAPAEPEPTGSIFD